MIELPTEDDPIMVLQGDSLEVLPEIESASVYLVLTDPPYGHNNNNGDLIHRWEGRSQTMERKRTKYSRRFCRSLSES